MELKRWMDAESLYPFAVLMAGQNFDDLTTRYLPSGEISAGHLGHRALTLTVQSVMVCRKRRRAEYSVLPSCEVRPPSPNKGTWAVRPFRVQLFQTTHT